MKNERGELIGVDVEIAKAMAEKLGVGVRFNRDANSFNEVIDIDKSKAGSNRAGF